jgi:hypothetical protein
MGVAHSRSAWSCSHTDTIDVTLTSNAIAYRLDWSDGTSAVIPADLGVLRGWSGRDAVALSHRLEIGHVSCLGNTVEPQALATLREFRLAALFVDGSERRFGPAHAQIHGDVIRLPNELLHAKAIDWRPSGPPELLALPPLEAPNPSPTSAVLAAAPGPSDTPARSVWSMIGALVGLVALAAAGSLWGLRRFRDHVPR